MAGKNYTKEFKAEAAKLVSERGYTQIEAARSLGIPKSCIQRWVKGDKRAFPPHKNAGVNDSEEVKQLKKEIERLRMEREILKKAAAFFAKENL